MQVKDMNSVLPILLAAVLLMTGAAPAQTQEGVEELQKLGFLEGYWKTRSEFTRDGTIAYGTLRYEWVLGGNWLKVTFIGDHPSGRVWEAHGMIGKNYDAEGFIGHIFFGPDDPVVYTGLMINENTYRMETTFNGVTSGIDYINRSDGTVYQENWVLDAQGSRRITLKTTYEPLEE
jgi:hypothetical protein